ncbi:MAG: hypothetical protein MUF34_26270 [Polyangiaceae bacterium]|jgi:hypothetical protein|nr:hypothetical protein [Polyangiaceae bacterium]
MMVQAGDVAAGFVVEIDPQLGLVHSRCWGFWSDELAASWQGEMLAAVHRERAHAWCALVDLDGFAPQRPSVQEVVRTMVVTMAAYKPRSAILLASNAITKLQLVRLLREERCTAWSFHARAEDAMACLREAHAGGSHVGGR